MPVVSDFTALLSGSYWNGIEVTGTPVIVTFSFPTTAPAYDTTVNGFTSTTAASFQPFTAAEQAQAIQALGEWAAASGLVFLEVAPGQGDINFQNVDFNTTSYAGAGGIGFYPFGSWNYFSYPYFTSSSDASGDVFMNSQFLSNGQVNYGTLLHEIGHAIGLKHPTEVITDYAANPAVVHDQVLSSDDPTRTIMATVGDGSSGSNAHLHPLDQAAAADIYGPAGTGGVYTTSASGSNSVSIWSWDATTQTLTQTAAKPNDVIRGTSVNDVIHATSGNNRLFALGGNDTLYAGTGDDSLYGGSGNDVLVGGPGNDTFYVNSTTTTVIAQPGGNDTVYSTVSFTLPDNVKTLYLSGQGLTGKGNNQADSIFGDGTYGSTLIGGTGQDYIVGGAGNDVIEAGTGPDLMYGGGGDNIFVFASPSDAPIGATMATIGDFSEGHDKIDLSAIKDSSGHPLSFIGTNPFTHVPGQLNEVASGGNTIIEGDINGDGVADFEILLYGVHTLQTSNFILTTACYCKGTRIKIDKGEIAVEELAIGDKVMTMSGAARPIKWIGKRGYAGRFALGNKHILPICFKAGSLDDNVPKRDLWISPHHAMYLEGVLIEARNLVNGVSIVQAERIETVEYFHIELDSHDVIIAEGSLSESFIDDDSRGEFHNAHEFGALYPDAPRVPPRYCAPRRDQGYEVEAARRRVDARAGLRAARDADMPALRGFVDAVSARRIAGWAQNPEHPEAPVCLDLLAGGQLLGRTLANRYRDDLAHAGLGSGHHGFDFTPPPGLDFAPNAVEVRRSLDGARLDRSADIAVPSLLEERPGLRQAWRAGA